MRVYQTDHILEATAITVRDNQQEGNYHYPSDY